MMILEKVIETLVFDIAGFNSLSLHFLSQVLLHSIWGTLKINVWYFLIVRLLTPVVDKISSENVHANHLWRFPGNTNFGTMFLPLTERCESLLGDELLSANNLLLVRKNHLILMLAQNLLLRHVVILSVLLEFVNAMMNIWNGYIVMVGEDSLTVKHGAQVLKWLLHEDVALLLMMLL